MLNILHVGLLFVSAWTWFAHLKFNKLNLIKCTYWNRHLPKFPKRKEKKIQCIHRSTLCLSSFFVLIEWIVHLFWFAKKFRKQNWRAVVWFYWITISNFIKFGVFIENEWIKADMCVCGVHTVYGLWASAKKNCIEWEKRVGRTLHLQ